LITLATLAALGFGAIAPAQDRSRDRRDRDRDRDGSSSSYATTQPAPSGYNERYAILEQRNVFVRDRSRPTSRPVSSGSSSTQPTRRSIEESLVVRGIAMEEYGYRAYVEDLNTGNTLRLSPGDALGRGHVSAVALDAIAYEHEGTKTWIDIGSDLTGKTSIVAAASPYAAAATTSPATLPANVPNLTVEQRMRLRVQLQNQQRAQ
jgi:hypothetical protein